MRFLRSLRARSKTVLLGAGVVLASITIGLAAEYRIDHIEVFNSTYVNIHFDTLPNRTYALQYRTRLDSTNTTGWTNLFVAPAQVFPNHYVVSDFRTNAPRFYRLRVTP